MSRPKRTARRWIVLSIAAVLLLIPLFVVGDLFLVPSSVSASRKAYDALQTQFIAQPELPMHHTMQLARIVEDSHRPHLSDVPSDTLVAYLYEQADLQKRGVSIFPGEEGRIILSKREEHALPLVNIILSLEVELVQTGDHLTPELISVRRGGREVATDLGWAYFGPELQLLEQLGLRFDS